MSTTILIDQARRDTETFVISGYTGLGTNTGITLWLWTAYSGSTNITHNVTGGGVTWARGTVDSFEEYAGRRIVDVFVPSGVPDGTDITVVANTSNGTRTYGNGWYAMLETAEYDATAGLILSVAKNDTGGDAQALTVTALTALVGAEHVVAGIGVEDAYVSGAALVGDDAGLHTPFFPAEEDTPDIRRVLLIDASTDVAPGFTWSGLCQAGMLALKLSDGPDGEHGGGSVLITGSGDATSTEAFANGLGGRIISGFGTAASQVASTFGSARKIINTSAAVFSQNATADGDGQVTGLSLGSGILTVGNVVVAGSGVRISQDLGTPPDIDSGLATVDGDGQIIITGSGQLQMGAATVVGLGSNGITGIGQLASDRAVVAGSGGLFGSIVGAGTASSQAAQVAGAGFKRINSAAVLLSQAASVDGIGGGLFDVVGAGALQAGSSIVSGSSFGVLSASGALAAQRALVVGRGDSGNLALDGTWEDDDVSWGGVELGSRDLAPMFIQDDLFKVYGYGLTVYLDSYLEKTGIVLARGREVEVGYVYPHITGPTGSAVQVSLGSHETPNGAIDWEGPYDFIIGEDTFVDFSISGNYIAIRFESSGIPVWALQSYDIEYRVVGNI